MKELMNDLNVSTYEELHQFMMDNPDHDLVKQLNTFFMFLRDNDSVAEYESEV